MKGLFTDVEMNSDNVKVVRSFIIFFCISLGRFDVEIMLFSAYHNIWNHINNINKSLLYLCCLLQSYVLNYELHYFAGVIVFNVLNTVTPAE